MGQRCHVVFAILTLLGLWIVEAAYSGDSLPDDCNTESWRSLLEKTWIYCLDRAPWHCMHHPFFTDESWESLARSLPWNGKFCRQGVGAAAVIFLRDLEQRPDNILKVDLMDAKRVVVSFGSDHQAFFDLDYEFAPFPYSARDLLPFRERTTRSMIDLCDNALQTLLFADITWLPWLGLLRFWTEAGHEKYRTTAGAITPDVLVPIEAYQLVLDLRSTFKALRRTNPVEALYMYEVYPHRLVQISNNYLPELGDGIDLRRLCPTCSVLNVFFYHSDGSLTTDAGPCQADNDVFLALKNFRDFNLGGTLTGEMPQAALELLFNYGEQYFSKQPARPCSLWPSDFLAIDAHAYFGDMSAALASSYSMLPGDMYGGKDSWVQFRVGRAAGADAAAQEGEPSRDDGKLRFILPATDFSKDVMSLNGAAGWFEYMEMRLSAQHPALAIFHAKLYMKKLMQERSVPIPRIIYGSMSSPDLPFKSSLPRMEPGYVIKPTHLAESHHVFVIDPEGTDLLTGASPTFEEVQANISEAWSKSLGDYDQHSDDDKEACARSKRYAQYLEGRSCTNWALYHCPPGVIIEELVRPSESYEALQNSAFVDQNLDITWRRQPDEIKCHVIWGKVFVAEWVSSGAFLGFIFRHGYVKDTIAIGPRTLEKCFYSDLPEGQVCEFEQMWGYVVETAERAAPPGVDYLRVDIFPNGGQAVVNEMTTASYSTLLEEWMLDEMMRRVKEGYLWRSF